MKNNIKIQLNKTNKMLDCFKNYSQEVKFKIYRISLTTVLFGIAIANSITHFAVAKTEETDCIIDASHNYLIGINHFLRNNKLIKKICLIIVSITMDTSALYLSYDWIKYRYKWKRVATVIQLLIIKLISTFLFSMKRPRDNLLEYPGFPSILVSYQITNDIFFSCLIGLNLIFANEFEYIKNKNKSENKSNLIEKIFSLICYLNIFLQLILDISIRSHYIIDELSGLIISHLCIISDSLSNCLDYFIPLKEERKIFQEINAQELQTTNQEIKVPVRDSKTSKVNLEVITEEYFSKEEEEKQ
jgi:hypothetical protein